MEFPPQLRFSTDHEWVALDGARGRVGITDYAQDALGDVVYVELPALGLEVLAHAACAEVESTKSVSEIYAPLSGRIVAVNDGLTEAPELVNQDPYGSGWIFEIELADPTAADGLLDAGAYRKLVEAG